MPTDYHLDEQDRIALGLLEAVGDDLIQEIPLEVHFTDLIPTLNAAQCLRTATVRAPFFQYQRVQAQLRAIVHRDCCLELKQELARQCFLGAANALNDWYTPMPGPTLTTTDHQLVPLNYPKLLAASGLAPLVPHNPDHRYGDLLLRIPLESLTLEQCLTLLRSRAPFNSATRLHFQVCHFVNRRASLELTTEQVRAALAGAINVIHDSYGTQIDAACMAPSFRLARKA